MKALVAGGAGFIGSHLCERLLHDGQEVTAVDSLITGRLENVSHLLDESRFRLCIQDVCEPLSVECDAVFHLASPASPVAYGRYPLETLRANSLGTERLLELARHKGARFLFASTSEVYGNALEHPQRESYWGNVNPAGPRSCYDEGKRYAEALIAAYGRLHGLDVRVARLFNVYGPRNDPLDGRVVPNFVTRGLAGEALEVHGDGRQTRSLCFVSDIVAGLLRLMRATEARGATVNLGSEDEVSVSGLASTVRRLTGGRSPIVHLPPRPEEIERRRPSLELARRLLGWQPETGLEEGLRQTIAFYDCRGQGERLAQRHGASLGVRSADSQSSPPSSRDESER